MEKREREKEREERQKKREVAERAMLREWVGACDRPA